MKVFYTIGWTMIFSGLIAIEVLQADIMTRPTFLEFCYMFIKSFF